jgi:uncharacterized protein YxjI
LRYAQSRAGAALLHYLSITDSFWITDERGDRIFFVNAKIVSLRHALELKERDR